MVSEEVTVLDSPRWKGRVLAMRLQVDEGVFVYTIKGIDDPERVESKQERELEAVS